MGSFLVVALAVPDAFDGEGLAFALGYLVVVLLPRGHVRARDVDDGDARDPPHRSVQLRRRDAPARGRSARRRLAVGAVDPRRGSALAHTASHVDRRLRVHRRTSWSDTASSSSSRSTSRSSSSVRARPGYRSMRATSAPSRSWRSASAPYTLVGLLQRRRSGRACVSRHAPPERRPQLAVTGFGYWHYGILLAIVAVAAGLKKAIAHPLRPAGQLDRSRARRRRGAVHPLCDVGFRRTFGLERNRTGWLRGGRTRHHPARDGARRVRHKWPRSSSWSPRHLRRNLWPLLPCAPADTVRPGEGRRNRKKDGAGGHRGSPRPDLAHCSFSLLRARSGTRR